MSDWIKTGERLPEPYMSVLGYIAESKEITVVHWHRGILAWVTHIGTLPIEFVSHWQPLPDAPEVDE
jgi:hypothetical protein